MGFFKKFRKRINDRRQDRQEFLQETMKNEKEIRKQRIKSRENIVKQLLEREKKDPCLRQHFNMERLNEFVSDENKSYSVKKMIAIWVTLGYLITNFFIFGLQLFPLEMMFQVYLIFNFVAVMVILSYFYTSFKIGEIFRGMFRY